MAVRIWNMMGGAVDWGALPIIAELLGIEDVEPLIYRLLVIRGFKSRG